jgi:hypothetical protein
MAVEELAAYFEGIDLPEQIEMVTGVMIEDLPLFLQSHFDYINNNPGLKSIEPFLQRLNQLRDLLEARS